MARQAGVFTAPAIALLVLLVPATRATAAPQEPGPSSSHVDAYWYGRLGYGTIASDGRYSGPSFGFGRRIEHDAFGLDLLLASGQVKLFGTGPADLDTIGGIYTHAYAASVLTVKGLYFLRPSARATIYVGAGAGWGAVSFGRTGDVDEDWRRRGLETAFTVGYAFARASTSSRLFVEVDLARPLGVVTRFSLTDEVLDERRVMVLVVSLGAGW